MRTIDRAALIVRHRQPYLRWASGIDTAARLHAVALKDHVSVYLVPEDPEGVREAPPLTEFFLQIFEAELEKWCPDEALWPPGRDFRTFKAWFDVTAQSMVVDLGWTRIKQEEC